MVSPPPNAGRVLVTVTLATLAIFGGLVLVLTLQLRERLHAEVLRREAEAIQSVALLQLTTTQERLVDFGAIDVLQDVFVAVLESSRLRGVFGVQLFDRAGKLHAALPQTLTRGAIATLPGGLPAGPEARFIRDGSLAPIFGEATRLALLEVTVPLEVRTADRIVPSLARYWIDGSGVAAEFARTDRRLIWQAGIAFVSGALLVGLVLAWAFSRLAKAHQQLVAQSTDLARANQELDFAAKTGALGAISAHLIHGLKNPLAGLEGFVVETGQHPAEGDRGEAWRAAMDTTRRLRALVNEVVTVMRDEADGGADFCVPVAEVVEAARARMASAAETAGITLQTRSEPDVALSGRAANLAGLVLANLITNAIEASPRDGRIEIAAGRATAGVEFTVSDTGVGLPAEVRASLFRPVRSGKRGGGGVGLAISQRLARHAGGDLELVRSDARGTVFRLFVPSPST